MKKYVIKTFDGSKYADSVLFFTNKEGKAKLEYESNGMKISAEDDFPFLALVKIRKDLEKLGLLLLCNGSKKDVYSSGGSLMSLKAYELKMGEPATRLLNILEQTDEVDKIATVDQQKSYRDKWLESLK